MAIQQTRRRGQLREWLIILWIQEVPHIIEAVGMVFWIEHRT